MFELRLNRENMKSNRMAWGIVALVVLATIAISFGTTNSYSQKETTQDQTRSPFGDLSKYASANYDVPTPASSAENETRKIKNKRYDKKLFVQEKPNPETIASVVHDAEPIPSAIPFTASKLVIIGEIIKSGASLSNDKTGIYSEYAVNLQTTLKEDKKSSLPIGKTITVDRSGGVVNYPNGQKVLYLIAWQGFPEIGGRYLFFLDRTDDDNPNYRIITAYRLKDGTVTALDNPSNFLEFNGMKETEFTNLVLGQIERQ